MKSLVLVFLGLFGCLLTQPARAEFGLIQTSVSTNVDAAGNVARAGNYNTDNLPGFNGSNLGTANTSIFLNGAEIRTSATNGDAVTTAQLSYRLYLQGIAPGDFVTMDLSNTSTDANGNQTWNLSNANINLANGLAPGTYTLEVYWKILGNFGFFFDSNGGNYSRATYTVTATTLPVSLIEFSVKTVQRQVFANWSTGSERNNARFELQRSADARSFETVAQLDGRGTTQTRQFYNATDESPRLGINYYRLRQTDTDGSFRYSPIRSAILRTNGELLLIGQPANEQLQLEGLESSAMVEISDLQGRVLYRQPSQGSQARVLTAGWPSGTYLLRVTEPLGVQARRIVVQH